MHAIPTGLYSNRTNLSSLPPFSLSFVTILDMSTLLVYFCNYDPERVQLEPDKTDKRPQRKAKKAMKAVVPGAWFRGVPPPDENALTWADIKKIAPTVFTPAKLANLCLICAHMKLPKLPSIRPARANHPTSKNMMVEAEAGLPQSVRRVIGLARKDLRAHYGWVSNVGEEHVEGSLESQYGEGTDAVGIIATGFKRYGASSPSMFEGDSTYHTNHHFAHFDLRSPSATALLTKVLDDSLCSSNIVAVYASIPESIQAVQVLTTVANNVVEIARSAAEVSPTRMTLKVSRVRDPSARYTYAQLSTTSKLGTWS